MDSVERLQSSDKRLILISLLVAAVSVAYILANYRAAFPQASIDLRHSKEEITSLAQTFLSQQGLSTAGFRNLTLFDPDEGARFYLERELGLEEANRLMQDQVNVWRWRARWFRPPDKEELITYLSPGGRIVGFRHVVPEAAPGAKLARDAARQLAEQFLRKQTDKPHRLIEQQTQERPGRLDHVFQWEQDGFRAKDATYRRTIVIQGSQVGEYSEFLHVPEQWQRDFAALRSSNDLFQWGAEALYVLLGAGAVAALIVALRRREIPWRALMVLCGAVGVLTVVNELNQLPFFVDNLPTSSPYRDMILLGLLQAVGAGVGAFFYVIVAGAAGEPLYRRAAPSHLAFRSFISRRVLRTRKFFLACVAGYGFAAGHIAFVVAFYLLGRKVGMWSPQDVDYSDLLSTSLPWLYPLTISLLAATSEEFWFRLLAIPLLKRYLRSTWIAVILPAFVWGFLHSNYPQQPGYVRGIEVGVIGVASGFLMLRYGILATLIWHYTVDAILIGTFLFESPDWYFRLSGIVVAGVVMLPLAVSVLLYWRNGGFETDEALLNSQQSGVPISSPVEEMPEQPAEPVRATWPRYWLYVAAGIALLVGLFARPMRFGDFISIRVTASEAAARADQVLRQRNIDPGSLRRVTQFVTNLNVADFEYVRRQAGSEGANRIVRERTFAGIWLVRYFRPMQSEEWLVYIDQAGVAYRMDHELDEKAPGAKLDHDLAQQQARSHLTGFQHVHLEHYRLVDSQEQKLDNRTDHQFVWEDQQFRIGEATGRLSLALVGDQVSNYRRFLKLPEAWVREFRRPRLQRYIIPAIAGALAFPLLVIFIRRIGSRRTGAHYFRWKIYLIGGATGALAFLLAAANNWPTTFANYDTAKPLENYVAQTLLYAAIMIVLAGGGLFLLLMAADLFLQLATGHRSLPRPSPVVALCTAVVMWGLFQGLAWLEQQIPGDRLTLPLWSVDGADSFLPALGVLSQAVLRVIGVLSGMVIIGAAVAHYAWHRKGFLLIGACVVLAALSTATNVPQFAFQVIEGVAGIALIVFLIRTCGVDLFSFGAALFWIECARAAVTLAAQPAGQLRWNGIATIALSAIAGVALLTASRKPSTAVGQRLLG